MTGPLPRALLLLVLAASPAPAQGPASAPACPVPPGLEEATPPPLPHARAAVARHRLAVLAVGGTATTRAADADQAGSYPARMQAHLAQKLPGVEVSLAVRAAPDASPRHRAAQLARDIAEVKPDLVLWASGTREAMRHSDPARYAAALAAGISSARAAGADIVLIEPQFAPGWAALPAIDEYRDAMRTVAALEEVPLFPRFALMQAWHEGGWVDLAATAPVQQKEEGRRVLECLGAALAGLVGKGLR